MPKLIAWFSPVLFRLLRRYLPQIPGLNHERLRLMSRRLVGVVLFGLTAVISLAAALCTAIIDAAVQFEQNGSLVFNTVMMAAAGFGVLGVVSALIARAKVPSLDELLAVTRRDVGAGRAVAKSSPPRRPEYAH